MPSLSPAQRYPRLRKLPQFRWLPFQPIFTLAGAVPIPGTNRFTVLMAGRVVVSDAPGRSMLLTTDIEAFLDNHIGQPTYTTTPTPIPNRRMPASRQILAQPFAAPKRETNAKYPKHNPCLTGLPRAVY